MGFDVGWCCLRASEFGAIHNRERIGIVAHARQVRHLGDEPKIDRVGRNWEAFNDPYSSIEAWQQRCNLFEPKLLRNVDGVPGWVDRIGCLGNAVVPQQFYPIFAAIAEYERKESEK
jgi:DNA (cytosine-5)-methyltransferase 1